MPPKPKVVHSADAVCGCLYCQMIDIMWGDPLLNPWETKFIESVARYGWFADYTDKQKAVIRRIFNTQRAHYAHSTP